MVKINNSNKEVKTYPLKKKVIVSKYKTEKSLINRKLDLINKKNIINKNNLKKIRKNLKSSKDARNFSFNKYKFNLEKKKFTVATDKLNNEKNLLFSKKSSLNKKIKQLHLPKKKKKIHKKRSHEPINIDIDEKEASKLKGFNLKNKNLYFIHIPKTSGTSLESKQVIKLGHAFNVKNIYRTPAKKGGYKWYDTNYWHKYRYPDSKNYKITIIRNPFDLLCSYYFHGEKLKPNNKYCESGWASVNYTHQFKSFKEFIDAYCDDDFKWHQPAFKQFLFSQLFDEKHRCVADIIIKYEYRGEAIDILNSKLKFKINKEKKTNKTTNKKKSYKEYYDQEMIDKVNKKCQRELEYFNYNFNGSTKKEVFIVNPTIKYDIINDCIVE
jgi:hypothetical protein